MTGGGSGIGAGITTALERAGYRVLTVNRHPAPREDHLQADLGDAGAPGVIRAWVQDALGRDGTRSDTAASSPGAATGTSGSDAAGAAPPLDLLVNNAAMSRKWALEDVTTEMFDQLIAVNMRAPLFLVQALAPLLARGGSIVTVSSIRGQRGFADDVVYQMAKGGLEAMTRGLAVELADRGIRVNAVAPGAIATPMNQGVQEDPAALAAAAARIPAGRFGTPEEVAGAVLYLADAPFVTGQVLTVDGGQTILGGRPVQPHQN